jgi:aryl-alcohol dehydrogenase-like predicted oxidoreductase
MNPRSLGRTGLPVSPIALGTMNFGVSTPPAEAHRIVARAREAGVTLFDCANKYGNGLSEEILGAAIAAGGRRDRVLIASKVAMDYGKDDPHPFRKGISRRTIIQECEASLRRLGTDWIDVYYLHRPDPGTAIDESLRALDDLIRQGKVRHGGLSMFRAWEWIEALWSADRHHLAPPVVEQCVYHILDRRAEQELLPMARTHGIGVCVYAPLASGMLSGKYRRDDPSTFTAGNRFGPGGLASNQQGLFTPAVWEVIDTVRAESAKRDCTPTQYALAWVLAQPGVSCVLAGPSTLAQLDDCLGAVGVAIDPTRKEDALPIDRLVHHGGHLVDAYWPAWVNTVARPHAAAWR